MRYVQDDQHRVHAVHGVFYGMHHVFAKPRSGIVNPGRIQEYDLMAGRGEYAHNPAAGGLRLAGYNRDFFSDHSVHQRRFSDIGSSYDRNETGMECFILLAHMSFAPKNQNYILCGPKPSGSSSDSFFSSTWPSQVTSTRSPGANSFSTWRRRAMPWFSLRWRWCQIP